MFRFSFHFIFQTKRFYKKAKPSLNKTINNTWYIKQEIKLKLSIAQNGQLSKDVFFPDVTFGEMPPPPSSKANIIYGKPPTHDSQCWRQSHKKCDVLETILIAQSDLRIRGPWLDSSTINLTFRLRFCYTHSVEQHLCVIEILQTLSWSHHILKHFFGEKL